MSSREQLIEFIRTIARPEGDVDAISDEDNLVELNIIDSLAIVQIVMYLETNHQLDMSTIDPTRLVTISGILGAIDR